MAGKHTGAFSPFPDGSGALPGFQWNERTTKAYAEGRGGVIDNYHPVGSDASLAWTAGATNAADPAYRFETAGIPGTVQQPFTLGMQPGEVVSAVDIGISNSDIGASTGMGTATRSMPISLPNGGTFTDFFLGIASVFEGGQVEIGVYNYNTFGNGFPGTLQGSAALTLVADTIITGSDSITVNPGTYCLAFSRTGTENFQYQGDNGAGAASQQRANSTPLPATWGTVDGSAATLPVFWATGVA